MDGSPAVIRCAHLFGELDDALVTLLKSLNVDQWRTPSIVPGWTVHHIAAHLLDTALRRLSACRDEWRGPGEPPRSDRELVDLINRLNADGVRVFASLSPALLVALTELVTPQLRAYFESLDPMAPAAWPVSWAGEHESLNWFDVAREFTERWHHQQQIRLATDRPGIMTPRLYGPVLDTFMRVLPHTYRDVDAPDGTSCEVVVPGECGGRWRVTRHSGRWTLEAADGEGAVAATCVIPADLAWRLFTKGTTPDESRARIELRGDAPLGAVVYRALAIVG